MIEFCLLMIFNLLYPDKNKTGSPKDEMNTAAAFFYGTSFESIEKETNILPDKTSKEQQTPIGGQCDYDDWFEF